MIQTYGFSAGGGFFKVLKPAGVQVVAFNE